MIISGLVDAAFGLVLVLQCCCSNLCSCSCFEVGLQPCYTTLIGITTYPKSNSTTLINFSLVSTDSNLPKMVHIYIRDRRRKAQMKYTSCWHCFPVLLLRMSLSMLRFVTVLVIKMNKSTLDLRQEFELLLQ